MADLLIVDDDKEVCGLLLEIMCAEGHKVVCEHTFKDALRRISSGSFDLVFLDVDLPGGSGLDLLPAIKKTPADPEVIIITGAGDPSGAELAINSGVWDYIEKTASLNELKFHMKRALEYRAQKKQIRPPLILKREDIIGESPAINTSLEMLAHAAQSHANVLITGETGTGKERFAQALHANSPRAKEDFVVIDCAALPESIVESLLFGHEKGAFTGADSPKKGMIEQADGGSLFLDEVGELPLSMQKAFLRVLQEKRFRPLGAKFEVRSDFRLIAATNRNLEQMVKSGAFREDLLFRIKTLSIELPPLRERKEDIVDTVRFYTSRLCRFYNSPDKSYSDGFFQALETYHWPGNVRELVNMLEKVIVGTKEEPMIFSRHLPPQIRTHAVIKRLDNKSITISPEPEHKLEKKPLPRLKAYMNKKRLEYVEELMLQTDQDIKSACEISGLSRARLYQLLKDINTSPPAWKPI
jgi:two-component system, NtrC family, response regulator